MQLQQKKYIRKELVIMDSSILDFHRDFYIPAIHKLEFHLTHVRVIGTHHCGITLREEFNCRSDLQDMLCRHDYTEHVVASFPYQIQFEYYGGNRSVSIEVIALEHLCTTYQETS